MNGIPPGLPLTDPQTSAILLTLIGALFLARVLGQLLVVTREPAWLPPMAEWYSGLLPYPQLLATQLMIVAAMLTVIVGLLAGADWAVGPHRALGSWLIAVAYVYAALMGVRYAVRMIRRPEQRWLGGCIPIAFHVVLATWLFVLGSQWRPTA